MLSRKKRNKSNVYRNCNELPIHNFNEVDSFGRFEYLKKNPDDDVSEYELQLAWLDILDELLTISDNKIAINIINKKIQFIRLGRKLKVLEALKICVEMDLDVDSQLKEYNTSKQKLNVHIGMLKNDINRIKPSEESEVDVAKDSNESNLNFENSIVRLIEKGYQIDRFKTVVSTWITALNRLSKMEKPTKKQ
jgi:hypothetical protein